MLEQNFKHGIFKEELKNRFLCRVEVDGEDTLCYIPASCRLSNFIDLTGREVLVSPVLSSDARTKYSVYALLGDNGFILLNMSKANEVVANSISSRRFSYLGKRTHLGRRIVAILPRKNQNTIVQRTSAAFTFHMSNLPLNVLD